VPLIIANSGIITQINVFTVPDGGQLPLIDLLAESARYVSDTPDGCPQACIAATTGRGS
jgi:hypothetical protein